jgi:tRNA dimethylallyltransferase
MVENGLEEETRRLLHKGYSPEIKSMQAIGYRHMVKYLMGEWDMDETVRLLQRDTRRYAKRQLTWFRSDSDAYWIDPGNYSRFVEKIKAFINETA